MKMQTDTHTYWVSWWHREDMGNFNIKHPCWDSGRTMDESPMLSYCALLKVNHNDDVLSVIRDSYDKKPDNIDWRFVVPKPPGWWPSDRFTF